MVHSYLSWALTCGIAHRGLYFHLGVNLTLLEDPDHTVVVLGVQMTACVAFRHEVHRETHQLAAELSSVGQEMQTGAGPGPILSEGTPTSSQAREAMTHKRQSHQGSAAMEINKSRMQGTPNQAFKTDQWRLL